jgi:hypothetical protein
MDVTLHQGHAIRWTTGLFSAEFSPCGLSRGISRFAALPMSSASQNNPQASQHP